jgi:hypothetical protein
MRLGFLLAGLAFLGSAAVAQTAPELDEKLLRAAFAPTLKDADSARFRAIQYKAEKEAGVWAMCGEVNAKNSYGGYVGFAPFLALVIKKEQGPLTYVPMGTGDAVGDVCTAEGLRP